MKSEDFIEIISTRDEVIHIKLKGFWDKSIVNEISDSLFKTMTEVVESYKGSNFLVLADLSDIGTLTDEMKNAIGRVMKYCLEHGLYKSIQVLPKSMVKMGVDHVVKKVSIQDFRIVVNSLEEAHNVINQVKINS